MSQLTWSVKDGGKLCTCGHLKCSHEDGAGFCMECEMDDKIQIANQCLKFVDRAEVV